MAAPSLGPPPAAGQWRDGAVMRRLREKAEELAGSSSPAGSDDSGASEMSEGEREFRLERARRLEQLSALKEPQGGILGSVRTPLSSVKTAMYKTGKKVGEFLEEAAEADMGGLGMDMTGGVDFAGDMEEAYQARLEREREERLERDREAEKLAAERRAQLREWRERVQVARDEVIAERSVYNEAPAADTVASPGGVERSKRNKAGRDGPARLTVAQGLAALRFALGFAEELPEAAVVEKALYELGISIPHDASRRAKVSVSCAALHIHTGWPPPVVGLMLTPSDKIPKTPGDDVVVRSFEEWRTATPEPEPEQEPELHPVHTDPLGLDSSSDSATPSLPEVDDTSRQHTVYNAATATENDGDVERREIEEPLGVVEAAECLRRALRLSVGSELPLPQRLRQVRNEGGDTAASRVGQLLKMVAQVRLGPAPSLTHSLSLSLFLSLSLSLSRARAHTLSRAHTFTRAHTRAHTRARTHCVLSALSDRCLGSAGRGDADGGLQ
eukprot:COSAG02_NODE_933_length_15812_cov_68.551709_7_plen_501_part_00